MKSYSFSLLLMLLTGSVSAATIGNGAPDQSGASDLNSFLEADDFTLSSAQDISNIRFWSLESSGSYAGTIAWAIYSNAAGIPGSALYSGSVAGTSAATGNTAFGFTEVQYDLPIAVTNLAAGTYWLVLHNGPENATPAGDFYWASSTGVAGNSQNYDLLTPGPWASNFTELAYELTTSDPSAVPEPSTFGLLAAGAALIGAARRRQNRAKETV